MAYKDEEIEVLSKIEALWTKVKEASENRLRTFEEGTIVERAIIEMAEKKLKEASK